MKRGYMMTTAALLLAGTVAFGSGCNRKAKEEADAANKPATKAEAQKMAASEGKKMTDDKTVNSAMTDIKNAGAATTQQGATMAHDVGTAAGAEMDKMKQSIPTTGPSMK